MSSVNAPTGLDAQFKVAPHFRLQWEEAQKSWVLLFPEGMIKLNGSAGEIMRRLDGAKSVQALIAELERDFDTQNLAPDVQAFLTHASQQQWIVS